MPQGDRYEEGHHEGVQDTRIEWLTAQNDMVTGILLGILGFMATGFVAILGWLLLFLYNRTEKVKKNETPD